MSKRASQAFRPLLEMSEERLLTTVLAGVGPAAREAAAQFRLTVNRDLHQRVAPQRGDTRAVVAFGRPRGGPGTGGTGGSAAGYINWGVITIINTTSDTVTFSAAASTYNRGQFQNFTLRPGGRQAYYAAFSGPFGEPTFYVSFDTIRHYNTLQVPEINIINESPRWVPRVGTEGRPYAIVSTVGNYNLVPMA
ncbi:hypothetical protein [Paludisphaera borealis]|uniref:Uncharacterized protein n=1 Tax=Paludisphaera borealis TaxID=1387353 RepID=A0A1U7CM85_9BACT|nr:hypothetical protein [Paludisphaera borealis]APW60050.1 hypothetical protein BSF38_01512 [Paludisphaera borealis]